MGQGLRLAPSCRVMFPKACSLRLVPLCRVMLPKACSLMLVPLFPKACSLRRVPLFPCSLLPQDVSLQSATVEELEKQIEKLSKVRLLMLLLHSVIVLLTLSPLLHPKP